jgi:maltooligosyltrehalose trehalohydrolase
MSLTTVEDSACKNSTNAIVTRCHRLPQGAELQDDGSVHFSFWAPAASAVEIEFEEDGRRLQLQPKPGGWHELLTDEASAGTRYRFRLPDGTQVPDPASRFQPEDVHGPSEVIDPKAHAWSDGCWHGRPWHEAVLYEMHVGTFTAEGTFSAAIPKLDHLVELGVTGIEIMPIGDFRGKWNWGYDGVLLYAPDSSYGRPEELKELVQEAHARGLMVILDVVYNHFGPDGNYLPIYAPQVLTDRHETGWGDAVNFDGDGSGVVREFIIHNALYWIEEFHMDGLRLDAVHAIKDESSRHLLDELADRVRSSAGDRPVHLILENEENGSFHLERDEHGKPKHYTAQWNDDVHHVLHTAATTETNGYYVDFVGDTEKLGRCLAEGFAFQGQVMEFSGKRRGQPSGHLPATSFVAFMQNHDQIGNRAFGERIHAIASRDAVRAIAAVYLLLPQIPMLFMGEEWATRRPFPFFCDFDDELGENVRKGRKEEFSTFPEFRDPEQRNRIPDPLAEGTFVSAKIDWEQASAAEHSEWLAWYKRILAVRRSEIVPFLEQIGGYAGSYRVIGKGAVLVCWTLGPDHVLMLAANLSERESAAFPESQGKLIWSEGSASHGSGMGPWSVQWTLHPGGSL